ncbi:MAG: EamA family transporter [Phenylobacterium sp.]|nr:EamA family transporter [Phenylobacterium sp.]
MSPDSPRARILSAVLPVLAVIGATAAFQVGAALAKGLFPILGPQGTVTLRVVLGALMLAAMLRPWRRWPVGAPRLPILGLGAATAGATLFFYLAIERLPQGVAIALQFLGPLAVAMIGSRRALDLVWAALAAVGVWCLVGAGGVDGRPLDPLGVLFALAAAASWAAYILWGRAASAAFGAATPAVALAIAALIVTPVGVAHSGAALLQPEHLPLAALVALVSTAIPFVLEMYALPRMPARTFAILTSLEPAFGALFGLLLLSEILGASHVVGLAAVIAAAAGAALTSAPRPPPSPALN